MPVAVEHQPVKVPLPSGGDVVVDPRERRPEVIARLLAQGVPPRTLRALLPEWSPLIDAVVAGEAPIGHTVAAGETPISGPTGT